MSGPTSNPNINWQLSAGVIHNCPSSRHQDGAKSQSRGVPDVEPARQLRPLPVVFTTAQGRSAGLSLGDIRSRRFTSMGRGLHFPAYAEPSLRDRCAAVLSAVPVGSVISHQTAAQLRGLPVVGGRSDDIHVTVRPTARAPRRAGVTAHYRSLSEHEVTVAQRIGITSAEISYLDHAQTCTLEQLVALGDALLRCRCTALGRLETATAGAPRQRGVRLARTALPLLDGRAESVPESLVRVRIIRAGLPVPVPQFRLLDAAGRFVARLDLAYPERRIAIEYDGRHHAERTQFGIDVRRHRALAAEGWLILRVAAVDLVDGSAAFLRQLAGLLGTRAPSCQ